MLSKLTTHNPQAIKFIQITDTHILDDNAESFNDFDTSASLKRVVEHIKLKEREVDAVLLTGDLVHEPTETAYQKLADLLSVITLPIFYLPGNHDNPTTMDYILGKNGYDRSKIIQTGDWVVILLSSCLPDKHSGELSSEELLFLTDALTMYADHHVLIALHHHPVSIHSTWMDAMSLNNSDAFLKLINGYDNIHAVIWGHIHQEFEQQIGSVNLYGTPSTCLQFKPKSDVFAVDNKSPAYRRLVLTADGKVDTQVCYLD